MTETLEKQPQQPKPKEILYKKIAIIVLILLVATFFVYAIMKSDTVRTPGSPIYIQDTYTKTIKVKALSPTGSDLGLGIFATDGNGYLAYPNDANITTGEKNIVVNGTYEITYYNEERTQFRIITHIERNEGYLTPIPTVTTGEAHEYVNFSRNDTV